tara:strand:- start:262 stop:684 length:423 start_codon:yes stop_codon:yes gene_type:complete
MAHYAFLDENNIVQEVLVGLDETNTEDLPDGFDSWEAYYQSIKGVTCKRTSYNTRLNEHILGGTAYRGNYAGIGYKYDVDNDVFIEPQPYASWTLDSNTWSWKPPVEMPEYTEEDYNNMAAYIWNEDTQSWDKQINKIDD